MSLLEAAKRVPCQKDIDITSEDVELCLAWLKDEVAYSQITMVKRISLKGNSAYTLIARSLREAFRDGKLTINY